MASMPVKALDDVGRQKLMAGWVHSHTNDLLRYARSRVKDEATADDLVQLTFVSAWQTMDKFAEQSSPRTWLFSILKHKLADHYRKVYREGKHLSGMELSNDEVDENTFTPNGHWDLAHAPTNDPDAFRDTDNERLDRALRHCLDLLPDKLRSAVEMKYLKERDSEAIQAALGISATNYWQQLHRAKLKLRECIQGRVSRTA
ncbi:MAG TPA: sigma-70 family RNA polymerase sigma factor [Flavobacteriales bacterium]|nr:sigma-70 family RNA polymerase sigma factor [Flavobacteriales bacterium]